MVSGSVGWMEQAYRLNYATVHNDSVDESYVKALAETVATARAAVVEKFNFNMPETIHNNLIGCSALESINSGLPML